MNKRGSIQCTSQNRNLHISKIRFLFPVSFTTEYKVGTAEFVSVRGIWCWSVENYGDGDQSLKAAEIRFRTPQKLANYFRFISQKKQASMWPHVWADAKFGENQQIVDVNLIKTKCGICTSLNPISISGFIHRWIQSRHCSILFVYWIWCWSVEKCGHQSLKTAEIAIRTPWKLSNYFRFVSRTIGVDVKTFLNRMQNLEKLAKELWT